MVDCTSLITNRLFIYGMITLFFGAPCLFAIPDEPFSNNWKQTPEIFEGMTFISALKSKPTSQEIEIYKAAVSSWLDVDQTARVVLSIGAKFDDKYEFLKYFDKYFGNGRILYEKTVERKQADGVVAMNLLARCSRKSRSRYVAYLEPNVVVDQRWYSLVTRILNVTKDVYITGKAINISSLKGINTNQRITAEVIKKTVEEKKTPICLRNLSAPYFALHSESFVIPSTQEVWFTKPGLSGIVVGNVWTDYLNTVAQHEEDAISLGSEAPVYVIGDYEEPPNWTLFNSQLIDEKNATLTSESALTQIDSKGIALPVAKQTVKLEDIQTPSLFPLPNLCAP